MERVPAKVHRAIRRATSIGSLVILTACGGGGGKMTPTPIAPTLPQVPSPPTGGTTFYTVGGSVSGVSGAGLTLQNNGGDNLAIAAGSTAFTFATSVANGATYNVTVLAQPSNPNETCTVTNGGGMITSANALTAAVTCSVVVTPPPTGSSSSFDNIDAAVATGQLTAETALLYKVYATFGSAKLPSQYKGNDDAIIDTPIMDQIASQYDSLSTTTQQALEPFLLRPNLQGSWTDTTTPSAAASSRKTALLTLVDSRPPCKALDLGGWNFEDRPNIPVRVWYLPADATAALGLADQIQNTIWPAFVAFHGLGAPLPRDDTNNGPVVCFGGDSKLDIYLTTLPGNGQGLTVPEGSANGGPVFILLKHDHANIGPAAAHEIMHAVQWAVTSKAPQESYGWIRDATANWAIDMVYGTDKVQFEQSYADCYLTSAKLSLDDRSAGHCKFQPPNIARDYGAYLYFQFLAKTQGNGVVAQVLNAMASTGTGLKAVDSVSKFVDNFPVFAKLLWNQDPINVKSGLDGFKKWDNLPDTPDLFDDTATPLDLQGKGSQSKTLEGNIKHLAIHYYDYDVLDPNIRSLIFYNHPYAIAPVANYKVSAQAFFKIGGKWDYAHWSKNGKQDEAKFYCLDVKAERIQELVIALSNDSIDQDITGLAEQPRISVSDVGCWEYKGTTSVVDNVMDPAQTISSTTQTTDVVFNNPRYATTPPTPPATPGKETFKVDSGTVTGSKNETEASCTYTSNIKKSAADPNTDVSLPTNDASSLTLSLGLTDQGGATSRVVNGDGTSMLPTHITVTCGAPISQNDEVDSWDWFELPQADEKTVTVNDDGTINDSYPHQYKSPQSGTRTMTWNLTPQREQ